MGRRSFLSQGVGWAALGAGAGVAHAAARVDTLGWRGESPFQHGVASGDPLPDRVILWSRVTAPGLATRSIPVGVRVARDAAMRELVLSTVAYAHDVNDFTVKHDAPLPEADRTYYYQFEALGWLSPVGRTRTAPAVGADTPQARFAVVSCSNYGYGYFNAYRRVAERADVDAVLHLGDYIYEHAQGFYSDPALAGERPIDPPHELVRLADYRRRYACYRRDPDLQECHRQHPFICIWDDHEITNDANKDGAISHPAWLGDYTGRKLAAVRAYHEWIPIRAAAPDNLLRIYRQLRWGRLVNLLMLDTRLIGRDAQNLLASLLPGQHLLGDVQQAWLYDRLIEGRDQAVQWQLLGQQVMFAPFFGDSPYSMADNWNGYAAERNRLLDHIEAAQINNLVVLTGDYHSSFAFDVCKEPHALWRYQASSGEGSRAVEFITPSVTSPGAYNAAYPSFNPHLKFYDGTRHGYLLLDVTRARCQADFYYVGTVQRRDAGQSCGGSWAALHNANRLSRAAQPSAPRADAPTLAPVSSSRPA